MKVKIKNYRSWFGPYQFMDFLFFPFGKKTEFGRREYPNWHDDLSEKYAESKVGELHLALANKWSRFHEKRRVRVKIDEYDTWSMDHTLGYIILPMLKQLKETKHGSPYVDIEDVPAELQLHGISSNESMQYDMFASDENDEAVWNAMHARWDWVMDEMIFAFECLVGELEDWESQFWTGESDIQWVELENGDHEMIRGPNDTRQWDKEGYMQWASRIENGFRLFGKYYRGLWD